MKATFNTLAKATRFAEMMVEGTFGEGLTLNDLSKYDKPVIKDMLKTYGHAYIIIRTTGTQNGNGLWDEHMARNYAKTYSTATHLFHYSVAEGKYTIETIKL